MPVICSGTNTTADAEGTISTCRNASKTRDLLGDTTRPSPEAMGILNMHIATHGDGVHAKMAVRHVKTRRYTPNDSEQPASLTRSPRQHADLPNELEGHVNAHSDVDGSNAPGNASVTPDLPARGAWRLNGSAGHMHLRIEHYE